MRYCLLLHGYHIEGIPFDLHLTLGRGFELSLIAFEVYFNFFFPSTLQPSLIVINEQLYIHRFERKVRHITTFEKDKYILK